MSIVGHAFRIASELFAEKKDKAGKAYMLHCVRVMMNRRVGDCILRQATAILHDVVEDCDPETKDELWRQLRAYFPPSVLSAVAALTHDPGMSYEDYIKGISLNAIARDVKLADLEDNSQITRLKGLRKKDFDRMEKYHRAYIYLSE